MTKLNYLMTIPIMCILLELIHLINLVLILLDPGYIRVFKVLYSTLNANAVPSIEFLFNINLVVFITVQLLFGFWFSMFQNQEEYDKNIGYLWLILGTLFLVNILLFGAISDWYILPIKNSPNFDTYLIVVASIITQSVIIISAFYVGFLMVIFL